MNEKTIERKQKQMDFVVNEATKNPLGATWLHRIEFPEGLFDLSEDLHWFYATSLPLEQSSYSAAIDRIINCIINTNLQPSKFENYTVLLSVIMNDKTHYLIAESDHNFDFQISENDKFNVLENITTMEFHTDAPVQKLHSDSFDCINVLGSQYTDYYVICRSIPDKNTSDIIIARYLFRADISYLQCNVLFSKIADGIEYSIAGVR